MSIWQVDYGALLQERGLDTYARDLTKRRDALLTSLTSSPQVAVHRMGINIRDTSEIYTHTHIYIYIIYIYIYICVYFLYSLPSLTSSPQVAS